VELGFKRKKRLRLCSESERVPIGNKRWKKTRLSCFAGF